MSEVEQREPRLAELVLYFLKLGTTGFGGPIALVGYMQRDLTETRTWFTPAELRQGVAFAQLAPGPLAAQLAIYLGWLRARALGATLTGAAFVAPSLLMVIALAILYRRFEGLPWLRGAFYGISAAVIAVIARSTVRLMRITLQRDSLWWVIFAANAIATLWTGAELLSFLLASGLVAVLVRAPPTTMLQTPGAVAVGLIVNLTFAPPPQLLQLFFFFAKAGAVVFGSGLAIVPFLYSAVADYRWLTEQQFLDAVAVSLITPGPVVITVAFMGHLLAGLPGALVAALGVFLPVYLTVLIGAPFFDRLTQHPRVRIAVAAFAAAATGALAGAAIILARRAIVDPFALVLAAAALLLLTRFRRLPEPIVILAAGLVGIGLGRG